MATSKEHPVPKKKTSSPAEPFDWESARAFVEIARFGSLRAAAKSLNLSINALRRRLSKLERTLGGPLFTRHIDGIRLTDAGESALIAARHMETAALALVRGHRRDEAGVSGDVKIAATDGVASLWLVPNFVGFHRGHPDCRLNIQAGMPLADILRLQADMAIQLVPPNVNDLKVVKLGRIHTMPFASPSYVEECGIPSSLADAINHRLILQIAEQVTPIDYLLENAGDAHRAGRTVLRTNSSSVQYSAILNGLGIGFLPTYSYVLGPPLVPIDLDRHVPLDVWLVYHPDAGRIPRVRLVIDWLMEIFSPRKYPWFSDDFIHPKDLPIMTDIVRVFAPIAEKLKR